VNSDRCCASLRSLQQRIRRIRPERNTFLLHHDNASPHYSAQTQDAMKSLKFTVSVVSVACCQVDVSATNWTLVQRSPTDCCVSLCVI
jgi:hypothetical protein